MTQTTTWTNDNPNTIYNRLAVTLGRQPTNEEASDEVRRILTEAMVNVASKGKLPRQRARK